MPLHFRAYTTIGRIPIFLLDLCLQISESFEFKPRSNNLLIPINNFFNLSRKFNPYFPKEKVPVSIIHAPIMLGQCRIDCRNILFKPILMLPKRSITHHETQLLILNHQWWRLHLHIQGVRIDLCLWALYILFFPREETWSHLMIITYIDVFSSSLRRLKLRFDLMFDWYNSWM